MSGGGGMGGGTVIRECKYYVHTMRKFDKKGIRELQQMCMDFMKQGEYYVE